MQWHKTSDKMPEEGDTVLARLEWSSGKAVYAVLEHKKLDDNAPWVMDGSELSFWVNVTHWSYFDRVTIDK